MEAGAVRQQQVTSITSHAMGRPHEIEAGASFGPAMGRNEARGSHRTRRWRKPDSNPRFRVTQPRPQDTSYRLCLISRQRDNRRKMRTDTGEDARVYPAGQGFESAFLQRRVNGEPVPAAFDSQTVRRL